MEAKILMKLLNAKIQHASIQLNLFFAQRNVEFILNKLKQTKMKEKL